MSHETFLREYFEINACDHQLHAAYGRLVKQFFIAESAQYIEKQVDDLRLLLNRKLVDHFAFEEQYIFPTLLAAHADPSTARFVAALREDHHSLLQEVARLNEMLADRQLVSRRASELQTALVNFLTNLQRHNAQEDALARTLPDRGGPTLPAKTPARLVLNSNPALPTTPQPKAAYV